MKNTKQKIVNMRLSADIANDDDVVTRKLFVDVMLPQSNFEKLDTDENIDRYIKALIASLLNLYQNPKGASYRAVFKVKENKEDHF